MRAFMPKSEKSQQTMSADFTKPSRANHEQTRETSPALHLQRRIGNQAMQSLLQTNAAGAIQTKLTISQPQDKHEQEADRVSATLGRAGLGDSESWSFTDRFYERLRYEIDPAWAGELPRTVMIDRDGKATVLPGVADLAQVRAWLDAQSRSRR